MLEKCELATWNPDSAGGISSASINKRVSLSSNSFSKKQQPTSPTESESSGSFEAELRQFVLENESLLNNKTNYLDQLIANSAGTPQYDIFMQIFNDLDKTMLNAILVLRIHLYEIEKVNELANGFVGNYKEALRLKLNSENIFKLDDEDDNYGDEDEPVSKKSGSASKKAKLSNNSSFEISPETALSNIKLEMLDLNSSMKMKNTAWLKTEDMGVEDETANEDDLSLENDDYDANNNDMPASENEEDDEMLDQNHDSSFSSTASRNGKSEKLSQQQSKNKRGVLPKNATKLMKKWLFQHLIVRFVHIFYHELFNKIVFKF